MGVRENLEDVRSKITAACHEAERREDAVTLVAVSKTHEADMIREAIGEGQRVFGENRVQEAQKKFPELKQETPDIELRLIGPLQSNKAEDAVKLFDVIESVDREKIARALSKEIKKQGRALRLYVQVNTGNEPQKAGIDPRETEAFLTLCREELELQIEGLMCIPPAGENPGPHFELLSNLAKENNVPKLSMGMSGDYGIAVAFGASSVRVGSAIFGAREYPA